MPRSKNPARHAFARCFGGSVNLMTPDVLRYGTVRDGLYYELSTGTDFDRRPAYGVTVVETKADETVSRRDDLSKPFTGPGARENALAYINQLAVIAKEEDT